MNFTFETGPNATDLGFFWIIAHYFGSFIIGLIVIALVLGAGYIGYRKYQSSNTSTILLRRRSPMERLRDWLGL